MNFRRITLNLFLIHCSFLSQVNGQSLSIDITGVGQTQIPIALAPFSVNTEEEQKFGRILNDVVQANLRRTAAFNLLPLPPLNPLLRHDLELSPEFFDTWKNLGTHALVVGSLEQGGKKSDVITNFRVLDTLNSIDLGGLSLESPNGSLEARSVAH